MYESTNGTQYMCLRYIHKRQPIWYIGTEIILTVLLCISEKDKKGEKKGKDEKPPAVPLRQLVSSLLDIVATGTVWNYWSIPCLL